MSVTASPAPPPGDRPAPLPLAPRIIAVRADPPFVLVATFGTGERRRLDLADSVGTGPVAPPATPDAFARVAVEPGGFGLEWPGGADLHRDSLYYGGEPA
ncbi:DUF2442 domain-containing protein [Rubrivirga sp. S365]|uniref:DUF2442 domain-containing protein n=1 Tax=Rubrivirga litoralis TaxID=3075598 RepID=A0ABU3BMF3_9BACT|nr:MULTISPECIES: DUF2442 domain-containing protein [unclassified Rubrivirga]MDT0630461.1 DUF2442 domain-containing protein [Rubrivirga sp. F394]MDT7857561.1 DUF2442 domain-containing protein [Rubrivirga sp. S365]